MQTTVTEYVARPCCKCGGAKFLSAFQHIKGGECFRCGATGEDPVMASIERPMTYAELCAVSEAQGFPVVRPETGDWLVDLFASPEEIEGLRQFVAAL